MAEEESQKLNLSVTETELRQLDAAYQPFPLYAEWSKATVDTVRWDRYSALLDQQRTKTSTEHLERARRIALRAAAVDTGAIEGLYEVDRGFTFTVAMETAAWETVVSQKGEAAHSLIKSQLHAYDYVVDLATKAEPMSEAAIRALHAQVVEGQKTYRVVTAVGLQDQPLPRGEYKVLPNHVRRRDGNMHSYAPADLTPDEMHRLVNELRAPDFLAANSVLQASYAHYAFVSIHPFADGNGRVARALASVFLYRARSIPLLMLVEHRPEYFASLETADGRDFQPFVDFTLDRALEAMQLVQESIRAATSRPTDESLKALKSLYLTRGGFTHEAVDQAGTRLLDAIVTEIGRQLSGMQSPEINTIVNKTEVAGVPPPKYRTTLGSSIGFTLRLVTKAPAQTQQIWSFQLQVPKDCGREDDLVLYNHKNSDAFSARIDDVIPALSSVLEIRIRMFAEGLLSRSLEELANAAAAAYRGA
jgi:Fic family protein